MDKEELYALIATYRGALVDAAKELDASQTKYNELTAKLSMALMEVKHLRAELRNQAEIDLLKAAAKDTANERRALIAKISDDSLRSSARE